jgi:hypothetical protein
MTVLGSDRLVPPAIIEEKVLESPLRGIKRVFLKREIRPSRICGK